MTRGGLAAISVVSVLAGCKASALAPAPTTLGAAISLKESMEAVADGYAKANPGKHLELVFGASGDLASQLRRGAPFDLLATAGDEPELRARSQIEVRCILARNTLVLVRGKDPALASLSWESLAQAPNDFRLAIGLVPQVPAGVYAEQALRTLGAWEAVKNKVVRGTNVRHVLDLVARGEADAGIVYATDIGIRPEVQSAGAVPDHARPDVRYPLYVSREASAESRAAADYLCGAEAARILSAHGFLPP